MLEQVINSIVSRLQVNGISAFRQYPNGKGLLEKGCCVCVSAESCKSISAGMGEYLGLCRTESGQEREIFGKRLEMELGLEIFAPFSMDKGADKCLSCGERLRQVLFAPTPEMKLTEMSFGAVEADNELGAFRSMCKLKGIAFFVAESGEDNAEFLDFVLKGRLDIGK